MTAERSVKLPFQPERPMKAESLPLVSVGTIASVEPIVKQVVEGKSPDAQDVATMVNGVAEDLRAQGIPVSSDDIRAVQSRADKSLSLSSSRPSHQEKAPAPEPEALPDINLDEYKTIVEDMVHNYGVDTKEWAKISHVLGVTTLMGDFISGMQRQRFTTQKGRTLMTHHFSKVARELYLQKLSPKGFVDNAPRILREKGKGLGKLIVESAWPFLASPVYWIMERQAGKMAGKMFMTERTRLQEQVNNRIADSLFMRNFEYLNNTPSGEMMEIINRGKDATIDLMAAVYEEFIPLKYAMWGSIGKQLMINRWDAAASLVKKVVLESRVKPNAQRIQRQNDEALKRWDTVNTKLLTTLQGLETVRTTGNAEAGSDVLYQALAERDFVEAGGMREKRRQDVAMNRLFDVMDIGIPVTTEGFKLWGEIRNGVNQLTGKSYTAADMFNSMADAWFRITGSQAEQQYLRQMLLQKTHLFVNRIIPDIQDIKRMEEVLGSYDLLDHPQGIREQTRMPVSELRNFDIKVENLQFKHILHNVNLDIPQGTFVTIKGPSGIGKSTLFRHLVGLYGGDGGHVRYGGAPIDTIKKYGDQSLFTKIAYANQNPQYFEDMTLRENLLLWTKQEITDDRIQDVLRSLKLDQIIDRLDTKTKHFSGGEMRRIGIARALLKDPKVLFLDEPTANLDAVSTRQVMHIIQELRKTRPDMTVVAITHDPVFEKIAEKIVDFEQINKKPETVSLRDHQVLEAIAKPS
ncbi:ABC transporter ATP-binding protein/permease [Patescibacteria group bacterium]|nr:ABC transporter ATP-binding protein/permease [Patescibacteria group bacterium]